jgi:hypothetical protein
MMLANFRNDFGLGNNLLTELFERGRVRREEEFGPCYVEINPFLCSYADLLPKPGKELRFVHVVRDPADWARSITSFKASTRFKGVIDYLPFTKPYPSPRPTGWRQMSGYEKALWRWNWCNANIDALHNRCASFSVVRYEDLFSMDETVRNRQFDAIGTTLDLPGKISATDDEIMSRENAFASTNLFVDSDAASRICGEMARKYGYDY